MEASVKQNLIIVVIVLWSVWGIIALPLTAGLYSKTKKSNTTEIRHDQSLAFMDKEPADGLMEALIYYQIPHVEIVYAQAKLETGNFTSKLCRVNGNLFGLYNSQSNYYYCFTHWTKSVEAYRDWVQHKLRKNEDYYHFLTRIGYAEDTAYIQKLKGIVDAL